MINVCQRSGTIKLHRFLYSFPGKMGNSYKQPTIRLVKDDSDFSIIHYKFSWINDQLKQMPWVYESETNILN